MFLTLRIRRRISRVLGNASLLVVSDLLPFAPGHLPPLDGLPGPALAGDHSPAGLGSRIKVRSSLKGLMSTPIGLPFWSWPVLRTTHTHQ